MCITVSRPVPNIMSIPRVALGVCCNLISRCLKHYRVTSLDWFSRALRNRINKCREAQTDCLKNVSTRKNRAWNYGPLPPSCVAFRPRRTTGATSTQFNNAKNAATQTRYRNKQRYRCNLALTLRKGNPTARANDQDKNSPPANFSEEAAITFFQRG